MTTGLARSPREASLRATPLGCAVFRVGFVYWTLFCIPVVATQVVGLEWIGRAIAGSWDALAQWAGKALFAIPYELSTVDNGSGDRAGHWVLVCCIACLALIAAAAWSLFDRARSDDARARALLVVIVRYTLAAAVLGDGLLRLFAVPFPAPSPARLLQRYGDSSPMGLLWTFMGASPAYVCCSGAMEVVGAALLLARRTTTLGALVLTCVLTNSVALNFCYDVPLKINSVHYLAMCGLLVLPDLRRLADVLWFHRPTQPSALVGAGVCRTRGVRVARLAIKSSLIGIVVIGAVATADGHLPRATPRSWCDGFWQVTRFARDGRDVAAIAGDATRWAQLRFQAMDHQVLVRWGYMDDSIGDLYSVELDEGSQIARFTHERAEDAPNRPMQPAAIVFSYTQPDPRHVTLDGRLGDQALTVDLERLDTDHMVLGSRGFHWISEQPYNR